MAEIDHGNSWLAEDAARVDVYLNSADVIILERNRTIKILIDLFRYHFDRTTNLSMLDLGCGDGVLTRHIRERYPDNSFHLLDGSLPMIERAKRNLPGEGVSFRQQSFEDYIDSPQESERYDFVYSANAIHHLDGMGKKKLYTRIYHQLRPRGLFVNIDVVKPASEESERWQFKMWTDWMNEALFRNGLKQEVGKYDNLPSTYRDNAENKPSTLWEQCSMLAAIGFGNVDCFYKYGIFAVFGGTKPIDASSYVPG